MRENSQQTALQRIQILFRLAKEAIHDRPDLAQRYIAIAQKIAMRTRIHLPHQYRLYVCRHCEKFILPGVNSRVRTQPRREPHVVVTCLHCGGYMRMPLKRKKRT